MTPISLRTPPMRRLVHSCSMRAARLAAAVLAHPVCALHAPLLMRLVTRLVGAPPLPRVRPPPAPPAVPAVVLATIPDPVPSLPSWFAELALLLPLLQQRGVFTAIQENLRMPRGRAGIYAPLDFVLFLVAYALSGEPTLQAFSDRLLPFADSFLALIQRQHLPHRATVSRFLHALDPSCVAALRQIVAHDLHTYGLRGDAIGGLWDHQGQRWLVFDVDGTRHCGRRRGLPATDDLPPACRRLDPVAAPGYCGRQRGEVVRTRTTVSQAHTQEWVGTFSGPGNGDYTAELAAAQQVVTAYLTAHDLPFMQGVLRLDGLYGSLAVLAQVQAAGLGFVARGKAYTILRYPQVQACLRAPATAYLCHPETQLLTAVFDVGEITTWEPPLTDAPLRARVLVLRHAVPPPPAKVLVGKVVEGQVYELVLTSLPATALNAPEIIDLYHHRGAFEQVLADEDQEQATDRWCCYHAAGQDCWQLINQWVWNLRVAVGYAAHAPVLRWTRWTPAVVAPPVFTDSAADPALPPPLPPGIPLPDDIVRAVAPLPDPTDTVTYGPLELCAGPHGVGRYSSAEFHIVDDHPICPAGKPLKVEQRDLVANGDLCLRFAARRADCHVCAQQAACMGTPTSHGRRISGIRRVVRVASASDGPVAPAPEHRYAPLDLHARAGAPGRYSGADFVVGTDGLPRCPAGATFQPQECRRLALGDVLVRYEVPRRICRACDQQAACMGPPTSHGRRISGLYRLVPDHPDDHSMSSPPADRVDEGHPTAPCTPDGDVWWCDAGGRQVRRGFSRPLRQQQVTVTVLPGVSPPIPSVERSPPGGGTHAIVMSQAERAHHRLSWTVRMQRNARASDAPRYHILVAGISDRLAAALGMRSGP